MTDQSLQAPEDVAKVRRLRRAELLVQRDRAARRRRRRGFALRLPKSQPLIVHGTTWSRLS
jgi:hypothetical protein